VCLETILAISNALFLLLSLVAVVVVMAVDRLDFYIFTTL